MIVYREIRGHGCPCEAYSPSRSYIHGSGSRFSQCSGENGMECCSMKASRSGGEPENNDGRVTRRTVGQDVSFVRQILTS